MEVRAVLFTLVLFSSTGGKMTPRVSQANASSSSSRLYQIQKHPPASLLLQLLFPQCLLGTLHVIVYCWQALLVGTFINTRTNIDQISVSPKPALKLILVAAVAAIQLFLCTWQKLAVHFSVCSCIFSCREDQWVYEWKTLIKQVGSDLIQKPEWALAVSAAWFAARSVTSSSPSPWMTPNAAARAWQIWICQTWHE